MHRTFYAIKTFTSSETGSTYIDGLSYTIRPGNRYLNHLAEVWALEGKVAFEHKPESKAKIEGQATVETFSSCVDESIWEKTKKVWRTLWP